MIAFHKAGLELTLFQVDQVFQDHPDYLNIRRILDELLPATAECATYFAKKVRRLSDRREAIKKAYSTYLDLHDLAIPLPCNALLPVLVRELNG